MRRVWSASWLVAAVVVAWSLEFVSCDDRNQKHLEQDFWPDERNVHIRVKTEGTTNRQRRQAATRRPIRIRTFLDPTTINALSATKRQLLTTLTNDAVTYFQSIYSVDQVTSPILLPRSCISSTSFISLSNDTHRACVSDCAPETLCGNVVPIPADHLRECYSCTNTPSPSCATSGTRGAGVSDADLVIYVGAGTTGKCTSGAENAVAFASACGQEVTLDRPIAGYINICPSSLNSTANRYTFLEGTLRHEIYHILVFSPGLFAFYRNPNGTPRTSRGADGMPNLGFITATNIPGLSYPNNANRQWATNTVMPTSLTPWNVAVGTSTPLQTYLMVTEKVTAWVRDHFACQSLQGALLENQGGVGTALTHWEKRTFESEVMSGVFSGDYSYSGLTLSLMEDSGWYAVNYADADTFVWGKNAGCDFVTRSCGYWITTKNATSASVMPFCLDQKNTMDQRFFCNVDHGARAICNLDTFTAALPAQYRYFTAATLPGVNPARLALYGGSTQIADYCPYYTSFSLTGTPGSPPVRSECYVAANMKSDSISLEYYGTDSRCILNGRKWSRVIGNTRQSESFFGSGCYRTYCTAPSTVNVAVGNQNYSCTGQAGMELPVDQMIGGARYQGSIVCPTYFAVCSTIRSQSTRSGNSESPGTGAPPATKSAAQAPAAASWTVLIATLFATFYCTSSC